MTKRELQIIQRTQDEHEKRIMALERVISTMPVAELTKWRNRRFQEELRRKLARDN